MPNYSGIWTEQAVMQAVGAGNWPGNPGAPTIGTATAGNASASVTFTAPTDTGQSAIVSYTVTSSPGSLTGTGSASPITVSGLTNGTAYTFTVTATNATGTGPASAASNSVTPAEPVYIEQTFSTYLYTGNGGTQTFTTGIDLSTKGGMIWSKCRSSDLGGNGIHTLMDTIRGAGYRISSELTGAEVYNSNTITAFNSTGFDIGNSPINNTNAATFVSWTFREQAKFFDVVTYTGNGTAGRTVAHNLGSVPGCIIVKRTDASNGWAVYHRSMNASPQDYMMRLNATDAAFTTSPSRWNNTLPTSTEFTLSGNDEVNGSGATYVAYIFAHNAGGFGLTGTDNVISCGSYTGNALSDGPTITLGYEPQWILVKDASFAANWQIVDTMRGLTVESDNVLRPNTTAAEYAQNLFSPTATGFKVTTTSSDVNREFSTFIYIAIRRGPMKVPTDATTVFSPVARTGTGTSTAVTTPNFPPDMLLQARRGAPDWPMSDRLRGVGQNLAPCYTSAENTPSPAYVESYDMTGATLGSGNAVNGSGLTYIEYFYRRAPSFFDEVCYTGTGGVSTISHNLTVAPELIFVKARSSTSNWFTARVVNPSGGANSLITSLSFNSTAAGFTTNLSNFGTVSATTFQNGICYDYTGNNVPIDAGVTYVAYLFATCAGVSKVGSYTGTGALQTVNCGFAAGARFVLIKRTDSTGDWYVYDSARGITASNDPYLFLNSTAAEVTGTNYVDTTAVGFQVTAAAPAGLNASGGTYIFLAIA